MKIMKNEEFYFEASNFKYQIKLLNKLVVKFY